MENYTERKAIAIDRFYNLLEESRSLLNQVSNNQRIELMSNGVTFIMIDPFSDFGDISDVVAIENGNIELDNGTECNVTDVTNLTDLIGLLEVIDSSGE